MEGKIRRLHRFLRGWAKNVSGANKKEKKDILDALDALDKKAEHSFLSTREIDVKHCLKNRIAQLLREEKIKWYKRAKTKDLLEGDSNTKYFQLIANGKHRKTTIFQLQDGNQIISGDNELKKFITTYYKGLFGPPEENNVRLDETRKDDIPQVTDLSIENKVLVERFTEEEVRKPIFQMEHNKAPGPDGFPAKFYQAFWGLIKDDLMALFEDFHNGTLPLYSLNFGTIILLPKCKEAIRIQQYRPKCLLNINFKIFTKVATNRITTVAQKVISPTQIAFLPGRNIMEGVVILHETIHEMHKEKQSGVIFKIDFEKAYDKVKWSFVKQTLEMKGFSQKWCQWVDSFMRGGHVGIKINDQVGQEFQTKQGLRQGDPLSPILFNIVADMLAIFINRAKVEGQIKGVIPHLVDDGLSILKYADDTIIFMDHDLEKANNLKLLLCAFEHSSGLKINFHKSEIFCFGEAQQYEVQYSQLFGCQLGNYPF